MIVEVDRFDLRLRSSAAPFQSESKIGGHRKRDPFCPNVKSS